MAQRPNQSGITLDKVRATQLRRLAERNGMSVSEWVDLVIRREWGDVTEHGLPGYSITVAVGPDNTTPVVTIAMDEADGQVVRFELNHANAATLAMGLGQGCSVQAMTAHGDEVTVQRKGKGLILNLSTTHGAFKHPLHPSIARDLAQIITANLQSQPRRRLPHQ